MSLRRWLALSLTVGLAGPVSAEDLLGPAPVKVLPAAELKDTPAPACEAPPVVCETPCPSACASLCGPLGRAWVSAEYLYGVTSGSALPPLATASPAGTPQAVAGVLGVPGTTVLIGGNRANNDFRSGLRANAGFWLNSAHTFGLEEDFFFLGRSRDRAVVGAGDGLQVIGRPFVNALTGLPAAAPVSFPGVLAGTVAVTSSTEVIGGGFNFLCNHHSGPCGRLDWLVGFRYLNLRDDLSVREDLTAAPALGGLAGGANVIVTDRFHTSSNFYGGTVGGKYERWSGRSFVAARAAVSLGVSHQDVRIDGSTTITPPAPLGPVALTGGLLAQASNIGRYTNDEFAVVPEFNLRVGRQVTDRARVYVGYNLTYWSNVVRAGDQIDLRVNPTLLPPLGGAVVGPNVPAFRFNTTDFWLQGVSIGGEVRY